MAEARQWHLVCYDIRDPKRWRLVFKLLKGYGTSLQYSIFKCHLNQRQLERMRWELEKVLGAEDSLMIAGFCKNCMAKVVVRNAPDKWLGEDQRYQII